MMLGIDPNGKDGPYFVTQDNGIQQAYANTTTVNPPSLCL